MEDHELIELRSEEVQEILGTPPGWMLRWGTYLIVLIVAVMVWLSYFIKYPDVISAPVVISNTYRTVSVTAKADGKISKLFVSNNSTVKNGSVLAIIESSADLDDMISLENDCNNLQKSNGDNFSKIDFYKNLNLGEFQNQYEQLQQCFNHYHSNSANAKNKDNGANSGRRLESLQKELKRIENNLSELKEDKLNQAVQFAAKQRSHYAHGTVTRIDLETANAKIADIKTEIASLERDKSIKEQQIEQLKSKIKGQSTKQDVADKTEKTANVKDLATSILKEIETWKQEHLILAPVSGRVSFSQRSWIESQDIKNKEELLQIIPDDSQLLRKISGEVKMPVQGAGKVMPGQRVVIMLESYPYQEFGTIEAMVAGISNVTKENAYSVLLEFQTDTLLTNYRKEIPTNRPLTGEAQIITEDKRFVQRIFEKMRGLSGKY